MGYTTFPPQNRDYSAVKYSADGVQAWSVGWASASGTNDIGQDIAVDPTGDVILTGNSYDPVQNENAVTVKFDAPAPAAAQEPSAAAADRSSLVVSPNPISGAATIRYRLARPGRARLVLLSADGRLLRTLVDADRPMGEHELRWSGEGAGATRLPAGTYLLRLEAAGADAGVKVSLLP
jgi:hypothetical protein